MSNNVSFANYSGGGSSGGPFSSVNVSSLRNALNQCKNSINHSSTDSLIDLVSSGNLIQASFKDTLKLGLLKLKNTRYDLLEKEIDKYLSLVDRIEIYKNKEKENLELDAEYSRISPNLYYTEERTRNVYDDDGELTVETYSVTLTNTTVDSRMKEIKRLIEENKKIMETNLNFVKNGV